jgi:soluble lytic murein transglycosylase-like protein
MGMLLAVVLASTVGEVDGLIAEAVGEFRPIWPVRPELVRAVIRIESAGDPKAVSHAGARGLMQVMPATGRRLGVEPGELFDPRTNVRAGVKYLALLLERYQGDLVSALVAYNAGPKRKGVIPRNGETEHYVRKVLLAYRAELRWTIGREGAGGK